MALLIVNIMAFLTYFSFCLSSELKLDTKPTISTILAAPSVLPTPSFYPPSAEISPDVAPLLPSPGGELPVPSASVIPTISSNPNTQYPDQTASVGPEFPGAPIGSELNSAAFSGNISWYLNLAVSVAWILSCFVCSKPMSWSHNGEHTGTWIAISCVEKKNASISYAKLS